MKKFFVLLVIATCIITAMFYAIEVDTGYAGTNYISIHFEDIRITTGFWFGILSLLCVIFFVYLLLKFVRLIFHSRHFISNWFSTNRTIKKHSAYKQLITCLLYEDYQEAIKISVTLSAMVEDADKDKLYPLIILLSVKIFTDHAIQLEQQGTLLNRMAGLVHPSDKIKYLIQFLQAGVFIKQHEPHQAIALLESLPENTAILKYSLLFEQYVVVENWQAIIRLWPRIANRSNQDKLRNTYLQALVADGEIRKAIRLYHSLIKQGCFSVDLFVSYRLMIPKLSSRQMQEELLFFNKLLKQQVYNALFDLALAYLYQGLELWQQAKSCYEVYLQSASKDQLCLRDQSLQDEGLQNQGLRDQAEHNYKQVVNTIANKLSSSVI